MHLKAGANTDCHVNVPNIHQKDLSELNAPRAFCRLACSFSQQPVHQCSNFVPSAKFPLKNANANCRFTILSVCKACSAISIGSLHKAAAVPWCPQKLCQTRTESGRVCSSGRHRKHSVVREALLHFHEHSLLCCGAQSALLEQPGQAIQRT